MAEKAKAKKAKTLSKKTSVKSKKRDEKEKDIELPEVLQLEAEEIPKRSLRGKAPPAEKSAPIDLTVHARSDKEAATASDTNKVKSTIVVREEKEIKAQTTPEIIAPIQPRVVVNKPEAPRLEQAQPQAQAQNQPPREHHRQESRKPEVTNDGLHLRLSQSLTKKLKEQAADEGISLEEFVGELLAESVVLRAWEIVERKNAMKGHQPQGPNSGGRPTRDNNSNQGGGNRGGQRQQGQNQNQGNKGHRGMSHVRYQTIMDDKATFLEYVRSQEKTRR